MSRYEVWSDTLATPSFVALTGFPTVARFEWAGDDLGEARRRVEAAKRRSEVVAANIRESEDDR
jgi:hypothetical protein